MNKNYKQLLIFAYFPKCLKVILIHVSLIIFYSRLMNDANNLYMCYSRLTKDASDYLIYIKLVR